MEKFGYGNMKKLVFLGVELGNVADKLFAADADASKWGSLLELADELMALPGVKWDKLDDEYKDFSSEEKLALMQEVKVKFDLADDKLERAIEGGLALALRLEGVLRESVKLVQSLKSA